jgi:N-acetylglucosamine kinase-like BadF-type ATPase
MSQPDPELIDVVRDVFDEVINRVPSEYSTPETKAYLAEFILNTAARGDTNYDGIVAAAASHLEEIIRLLFA